MQGLGGVLGGVGGSLVLSGGDGGTGVRWDVTSSERQRGNKGKFVHLVEHAPVQEAHAQETMLEARGRIVDAMRAKFCSSSKPQQALFSWLDKLHSSGTITGIDRQIDRQTDRWIDR